MKRTVLIAYVVASIYSVLASDTHSPKTIDEYVVETKDTSPRLWLASHLGHKRSQQFDEWDCDEIENYMRTMPWSIINKCTITEDKRDKSKSSIFNPRLGRDSDDVLGSITNSLDNDNLITLRSQFVPRLGKRLSYTPRLGREALK